MHYVHVSDDDVLAAMAKEQGGHKFGHTDQKAEEQPEQLLYN